jgi:hypothetical protein
MTLTSSKHIAVPTITALQDSITVFSVRDHHFQLSCWTLFLCSKRPTTSECLSPAFTLLKRRGVDLNVGSVFPGFGNSPKGVAENASVALPTAVVLSIVFDLG